MPEIVVQYVDSQLVERIRHVANERQCSINEVMLLALRRGLGLSLLSACSENHCDTLALDAGDAGWGVAEQGAFRDALRALAQTRPTQFAPEALGDQIESAGAG